MNTQTVSPTWTEVEATSNACFSSTNASLPLSYKFNAPYDGILQGVRLVHTSGGTKCGASGDSLSNWGGASCGIRTKLLQLPTGATSSSEGSIVYPTLDTYDVSGFDYGSFPVSGCGCDSNQAYMSLYSSTSSELLWYSDTIMYNVTINDEFILGICEGVCQISTHDNSGTSCAQVFFLYYTISPSMFCTYICFANCLYMEQTPFCPFQCLFSIVLKK